MPHGCRIYPTVLKTAETHRCTPGFLLEVLGQFLGQCMRLGAVWRGWSPRKQALDTAQNREKNRMVMLAVEIKGLTYQ